MSTLLVAARLVCKLLGQWLVLAFKARGCRGDALLHLGACAWRAVAVSRKLILLARLSPLSPRSVVLATFVVFRRGKEARIHFEGGSVLPRLSWAVPGRSLQALDGPDPFQHESCIPQEVVEALQWQAARTPVEVNAERESIVARIEERGSALWESGCCADWYRGYDTIVAGVSRTSNGPLLRELAVAAEHGDLECVDLLREGACLFHM